jgi:hypothetical protein
MRLLVRNVFASVPKNVVVQSALNEMWPRALLSDYGNYSQIKLIDQLQYDLGGRNHRATSDPSRLRS